MEFLELTEEEFNKECKKFKESSFYQTPEWVKIKQPNGWNHYYVGVKDKNKIVACSLILGKKLYLNKYMYYAPRGLLLDYTNFELLDYFINNLKSFLIKKEGVLLKIDPLVDYQKHDKEGNAIGTENNDKLVNHLKELGFKHHGLTKGYTDEAQFRWSYCLDITKSKEELLEGMDQRCRRCIRKYEKYPLIIEKVNDNNIKDFKDIMEHTAKRQNHFDRTTEYYQSLDRELKESSNLSIIYLDRDKYLKDFTDDKLYSLVSKDLRKKIPISAGVFIFDSQRGNYVYGGTYKDYMPLMAQYKLQIEMIKIAKEKGLSIYDFGGISGDFTPGTENYGVYEFKRGFGGYVTEYIGEFDLILNKPQYGLYKLGFKSYRNFKHLIAKILK